MGEKTVRLSGGAIIFMLALALLLPLIGSDQAMPSSGFLADFNSAHPGSLSATTTVWSTSGARCNICHVSGSGSDLNAYGAAWVRAGNSFTAIAGNNSDGDTGGATNLAEITANAQPGWRSGPNNTFYDWNGVTVTATNQPPPSTLIGAADPTAAGNQAPVLTNPGNKTVNENVLLQFTISATDDGPATALIFSAGSLPSGATLTPSGTFSWTPSFTQGLTTPYPVTITVTDAGGLTASQSFNITVGNVNRPPTLSPSPVGNRTVNENQTLTIAFSATDPDGDTLSFPPTTQTLPSGATLTPGTTAGTATFSWTPSFAQSQTTPYPVTITVTDAGGLTASQSFNITVGNVNRPPAWLSPSPIGNQTVTVGQALTIAFSASDPDGDLMTFSISSPNPPNGASVVPGLTNGTATFSWTPATGQASSTPYPITITVTDASGLSASQSFTITVNAAPVTPAITGQPANQTVTAPATATFSVTATGTAPLSYQWRKGGVPITGATASSYTTPATTTADNGALFSVVVTNAVSSVTSSNATLTVNAAGTTGLDYSIVSFTATEETVLRSKTPVTFGLMVRNVGTASGSVSATLVGSLNGVEVYRRTMQVSAPVGTTTTLGFPPYTPTRLGTIRWAATIQDPVPGNNVATASTEVERNGESRTSRERRRTSD